MSVAFFGSKAIVEIDVISSVVAEDDDEIVVRNRAGEIICRYRPEGTIKDELDNVYEQLFHGHM